MTSLSELTSVLRSKNAGALLCTLDLMFDDQATYERVRDCGAINSERIASLYNVSQNQVSIIPYDVAYAIKITVPRLVPSGSFGDTDIYGAQQHGPLLEIQIPD